MVKESTYVGDQIRIIDLDLSRAGATTASLKRAEDFVRSHLVCASLLFQRPSYLFPGFTSKTTLNILQPLRCGQSCHTHQLNSGSDLTSLRRNDQTVRDFPAGLHQLGRSSRSASHPRFLVF